MSDRFTPPMTQTPQPNAGGPQTFNPSQFSGVTTALQQLAQGQLLLLAALKILATDLTALTTATGAGNTNIVTAINTITTQLSAMPGWVPPPTVHTSPGVAGNLAYDGTYLYVRNATEWGRIALDFAF